MRYRDDGPDVFGKPGCFESYGAASALPALPAVGMATAGTPKWESIVTAQPRPRALKLPVGFRPSSLTYSALTPHAAPRRSALSSGVWPSPKVTGWSVGKSSWYFHIERSAELRAASMAGVSRARMASKS